MGREVKKKEALKKVYKIAEKAGKVTLGFFAFFSECHMIALKKTSTTTSIYERFIFKK